MGGWGGVHRYFRSVRVQKEAEGPGVGQSAGRDLPAVTPRIRQATVVRTDLVGQLVGSLIKRPASEARRVAYFSRSRVSSPSPSPPLFLPPQELLSRRGWRRANPVSLPGVITWANHPPNLTAIITPYQTGCCSLLNCART